MIDYQFFFPLWAPRHPRPSPAQRPGPNMNGSRHHQGHARGLGRTHRPAPRGKKCASSPPESACPIAANQNNCPPPSIGGRRFANEFSKLNPRYALADSGYAAPDSWPQVPTKYRPGFRQPAPRHETTARRRRCAQQPRLVKTHAGAPTRTQAFPPSSAIAAPTAAPAARIAGHRTNILRGGESEEHHTKSLVQHKASSRVLSRGPPLLEESPFANRRENDSPIETADNQMDQPEPDARTPYCNRAG